MAPCYDLQGVPDMGGADGVDDAAAGAGVCDWMAPGLPWLGAHQPGRSADPGLRRMDSAAVANCATASPPGGLYESPSEASSPFILSAMTSSTSPASCSTSRSC